MLDISAALVTSKAQGVAGHIEGLAGFCKKPERISLTPPLSKHTPPTRCDCAQMAELVDALASGASSRKGVEVRVLFWAPHRRVYFQEIVENKRVGLVLGPVSGPLLGPLRRDWLLKRHRWARQNGLC